MAKLRLPVRVEGEEPVPGKGDPGARLGPVPVPHQSDRFVHHRHARLQFETVRRGRGRTQRHGRARALLPAKGRQPPRPVHRTRLRSVPSSSSFVFLQSTLSPAVRSFLFDDLRSSICAGTYKIDVLYDGKPLRGSPFTCQSFDVDKVVVDTLRSTGVSTVHQPINFQSRFRFSLSTLRRVSHDRCCYPPLPCWRIQRC